ncbi:MAG: putative protein family ATPase [Gemmatimonadetes bacterium]|nr:putative protein family ATPase [Gemmatimonadota bacterium]
MDHPVGAPAHAGDGRLSLTEAELVEWGERFGRVARAPLVIALVGDLGAGKTTLARAICRGYGVSEEVTSPTFSIVNQYRSERSVVHHLDLYRLDGPQDLTNIGWDEIVSDHALVLVEWPERAGDQLPHEHVTLELEYLMADDDRRVLYAGGHA